MVLFAGILTKRRENAKKAKEKKYLLIKFEIIRLLHSKKPLDKWSSISKAIEGIEKELVDFLKNEPKDNFSNLDSSNLKRTIEGWLEKDSYLQFSFAEVVVKK